MGQKPGLVQKGVQKFLCSKTFEMSRAYAEKKKYRSSKTYLYPRAVGRPKIKLDHIENVTRY